MAIIESTTASASASVVEDNLSSLSIDDEESVYSCNDLRFEDLNLSPELVKGLYSEMKYERPSMIQAQSLPLILSQPHKNLLAQSHNGTGKSSCFILGMLSRVDPNLDAPQALCLCPTRELAIQNMQVLRKIGKFTGVTSELGLPAADKASYVPLYKRPPVTAQVIIGTPGTINKWVAAKKLGTSFLKILVFDEADHMLAESGFKEDSVRIMKEIVKQSPKCQVLLFSATFSDTVTDFASKIVNDLFVQGYNRVFVEKEKLPLRSVNQYKVNVPDELAKIMVIKDKLMELADGVCQTVIFVRTRVSAGMLHAALVNYGYAVTTVHGALTEQDRDKIIQEFRDGLTQVLIATDIIARGFDQFKVNLVVNYDLPVVYNNRTEPDNEVYLHRVGRTGRFGRKGAVFNLLCGDRDTMIMEKIETHFNHRAIEVPSWTGDDDFKDALKKAGLV